MASLLPKKTNQELQILDEESEELAVVQPVTPQEEEFCQLFCNGSRPYVGNATKCYQAVFGVSPRANEAIQANLLLASPRVSARVSELMTKRVEDATFLKMRVVTTLTGIMDEMSTDSVTDRFGVRLSSAPMRAVAVNAAREIGSILGWHKGEPESKVKNTEEKKKESIHIESGSNVTFNVIVPKTP